METEQLEMEWSRRGARKPTCLQRLSVRERPHDRPVMRQHWSNLLFLQREARNRKTGGHRSLQQFVAEKNPRAVLRFNAAAPSLVPLDSAEEGSPRTLLASCRFLSSTKPRACSNPPEKSRSKSLLRNRPANSAANHRQTLERRPKKPFQKLEIRRHMSRYRRPNQSKTGNPATGVAIG